MKNNITVIDLKYMDLSKHPFMSEDWQEAITYNIMKKFETGEPLEKLEESFIMLQSERFNAKRWKHEVSEQEYGGNEKLLTSNMELSNNGLLE